VIFPALVLISLAPVLWWRRKAFVLIAVVQAAALAFVLIKGISTVHEQQHRIEHFVGCQFVIYGPSRAGATRGQNLLSLTRST
jgi:hypothetical protein